jgi:2-aminobenzoate-CoA ligase
MRDTYPDLDTLPHEWLVPASEQPEYLPLPDAGLDEQVDLGAMLSDMQVSRGLGDAIAMIHHETGRAITFRELAELSDRTASVLYKLHVRPGDRVALRGPNCPGYVVAAIAAWKIGAAVTLIPATARGADVEFFIGDTQPRAALLFQPEDPGILRALEQAPGLTLLAADAGDGSIESAASSLERDGGPQPPVAADLNRVAIIWHTGGTTGQPKGCYHTQRRFLLGGISLGRAAGASRGQRWAAAAPMGHALGFIHSTIFTLLNGVTLVVISDFAKPKSVLDALDVHKVTQFTAVTATWGSMLELLTAGEARQVSALRRGYAMWQSSSAEAITTGWRERGIELRNNFGSTAFATWVLVPPLDRPTPQGWLGAAAPGYEVIGINPGLGGGLRPVPAGQPGRLAVRGPTGLTYWRLPARQRADVQHGYSLHDDLICFGTADRQGLAEYLGRTDYLISTAGNKVAPVEVEQVLSSHPAVREAVVFGIPDAARQEIVAAFVVLRDAAMSQEASDALRRELQDLVKSKLAPYKYPRRLDFIEAIPRDPVGKVQPRILRDRILATSNDATEASR